MHNLYPNIREKIKRLLIANRGEPAMRAIRTCKELGIESAVIYSIEDAASDWIFETNYALELDRTEISPDNLYLDIDQIVDIARRNKCDAVWPGWGFLSENAEFAQKIMEAGILWVGPPPEAMRRLGCKAEALEAARQAGFDTLDQIVISDPSEIDRIKELAFPLLLKPAQGGGGQGQRIINASSNLKQEVEDAIRQSITLFKDGSLIVQSYLEKTKHIELQMLGDKHGNICVLGTRDCSIQRRNQKIIEEGPAQLKPETLKKATDAAIALCREAGYFSAGTIETLLSDDRLYFLEVNTRLQVEHPVTEESTVIVRDGRNTKMDILAEMLSVALDRPLTFTQDMVSHEGYAIEARLYAEDPDSGFIPTPGTIYFIRFPRGDDVRVDSAIIGPSGEVHKNFDPMFAKLIVHDTDRNKAIDLLHRRLEQTVILGIKTNIDFLRRVTAHGEFRSGDYLTNFITTAAEDLKHPMLSLGLATAVSCVASYKRKQRKTFSELRSPHIHTIEDVLNVMPQGRIDYVVSIGEENIGCSVSEWNDDRFFVTSGDNYTTIDVSRINSHIFSVRDPEGKTHQAYALVGEKNVQMILDGNHYHFQIHHDDSADDKSDPNASPYSGKLVRICVKPNDPVQAGDELYVIESMKMESVVRSSYNGTVSQVSGNSGESVESGDSVVFVIPSEEEKETEQKLTHLTFPSSGDFLYKLFTADGEFVLNVHEVGEAWSRHRETIIELPLLFFTGFDVSAHTAKAAFEIISQFDIPAALQVLEQVGRVIAANWILGGDDHSDLLLDFAKYNELPDTISDFKKVLSEVLSAYGGTSIHNRKEVKKHLPRIFLSSRKVGTNHVQLLLDFVELIPSNEISDSRAADVLTVLLSSSILDLEESLRRRCLGLLSKASMEKYYCAINPPVALRHLMDYEDYLMSPLANLAPQEIGYMRFCIEDDNACPYFRSHITFPGWFEPLFSRWFEGYSARELYTGSPARSEGIRIFELRSESDDADKRLVGICFLKLEQTMEDGKLKTSSLETIAMETHRSIAQYEVLGEMYKQNHVFLVLPPELVWQWDQLGVESEAISPTIIRDIASRIAGFAKQSRVYADELLLNIERNGQVLYNILEVKHVEPSRILTRPPYPISERTPELKRKGTAFLDEKQYMRGKLLNIDRARLLFDRGEYEELHFPDVDTGTGGHPVGLNVFKGRIKGAMSLAYAGDFRIKGGALGEREGKKLASAVVLSYASGMPLIGIHDGAGADIRDSVASLGWAGAYFGSIANTGGFSSPDRFWKWFDTHLERPYFEKVLKHFHILPRKYDSSDDEWSLSTTADNFLHIHLNLGATVGMLVYGASISAMSIMADHPEIYRVLTGSVAVEKVTGEKATNYQLGGAHAHSRYSGDIDIKCNSEEEAIETARGFVDLVLNNRVKKFIRQKRISSEEALIDPAKDVRAAFLQQLDAGSFIETRRSLKGATQLLTGYASVTGSPVSVAAYFSPHGIRNPRSLKKLFMQYVGAHEFGLPLITFVYQRWYRIPYKAAPRALFLKAECDIAFSDLKVPRISIAFGPGSLNEPIHQLADISCYVPYGIETPFDMSRAEIVSHIVASDLSDCFDKIGFILPYLMKKEVFVDETAVSAPLPALPETIETPYDIRTVLPHFFDEGSFIELERYDAQPLTVGFATVGRKVVGIIADNPSINGGAQTAYSLSKFTRFNRLCERFGIPIIEFNDSAAFQPGKKQERLGIQGEGGQSLREECLGNTPRLAVTLRQNYGGRFIHANLRTLGPNRWAIACSTSRVGVMGADGAVAVLHERKLRGLSEEQKAAEMARLKAEYIAIHLDPRRAMALGYLDIIVPYEKLKDAIFRWCMENA
jgi:acetyl/propionyl-CoA carboxylase alpha subunit/acetyl-CoA carboxylase carboxyltransferase component